MLSLQNTFEGLKNKTEKILGLNDKKAQVAVLTRDQIEILVNDFLNFNSPKEVKRSENVFYKNEALLREDLLRRFKKILPGNNIPENTNWFQIQNLFEKFFTKNGFGRMNDAEKEYENLAEKMGYSVELFKKIMHCVGKSHCLRLSTSGTLTNE